MTLKEHILRFAFWAAVLALMAFILWLPSLLPTFLLAIFGHLLLSACGVLGIAFVLLRGLAQAMRS